MKTLQFDTLASPIGTILLVVDGEQLCSLDFKDYEQRMLTLLQRRYGSGQSAANKQSMWLQYTRP